MPWMNGSCWRRKELLTETSALSVSPCSRGYMRKYYILLQGSQGQGNLPFYFPDFDAFSLFVIHDSRISL